MNDKNCPHPGENGAYKQNGGSMVKVEYHRTKKTELLILKNNLQL